MSEPVFFWDKLLRFFFGFVALLIFVGFWVFSTLFMIINLVVPWHRLWRYLGVGNLVTLRFIMRMKNLYDTNALGPGEDDMRKEQWEDRYRYQRRVDGKFNDLSDPLMGSGGTRFGRNFPLSRLRSRSDMEKDLKKSDPELLHPNPREVSRKLLTRDRFRPARTLNLLSACLDSVSGSRMDEPPKDGS